MSDNVSVQTARLQNAMLRNDLELAQKRVKELEEEIAATRQNSRIMTDVRQLVPAEDARLEQAVLIAVDRAEKAEAELASFKKEANEHIEELRGWKRY